MEQPKLICHVHRSDKRGCFWLGEKDGKPFMTKDVGMADEFTLPELVVHVQYICAHHGIAVEVSTHPVDSEFVPSAIRQLVRLD